MALLGSTTGVKSTQAEWFAADLSPQANHSGTAEVHIAITGSSVAIAYTVDSGSNWVAFNNGTALTADVGYLFQIPLTPASLFNIRKSAAGDVTAAICEITFPAPRIGKSRGTFVFGLSSTSNSNAFYFITDTFGQAGGTTESQLDTVLDYAILIKRLRVTTTTSSKNAATPIAFRDDGVAVAAISVAAGSTNTEYDSGELSVLVGAGSKINWQRDTSGSSSGTLVCSALLEFEYI